MLPLKQILSLVHLRKAYVNSTGVGVETVPNDLRQGVDGRRFCLALDEIGLYLAIHRRSRCRSIAAPPDCGRRFINFTPAPA